MKSQKGFTVLELLIIIGMIGLLVGLALVGLNNARQKSRDDSRVSNVQLVQIALEEFKSICRNYPNNLDTSANNCLLASATFADFLPAIPQNPGNTQFMY